MAFETAGNDPRHGLIAVAHKYLFAVANELNMSAELSFQIADIDSSHARNYSDVTMLVICYLSSGMRGQGRQPQISACTFFVKSPMMLTSQTSIFESLCRNKRYPSRNEPEARHRPNLRRRVGSFKLQRLVSVKSSAVRAPRDLSGLPAKIERRL